VTNIHPTALVSSRAILGNGVEVGPFAIIEDDVVIGDDCKLLARVTVKRNTTIGCNNFIAEGAVLGGRPQHTSAPEEVGSLVVGSHNQIRENATLHCGLKPGMITTLGNNCLLMVNAHVGHDCQIGDRVILVNNSMVAGHVIIHDRAYISGGVGIHQFCRIGRCAMVGGQSLVVQDVLPYVTVDGETSKVVGLNTIGLKRNGFGETDISDLKKAYRLLYRSGLPLTEVISQLKTLFPEGAAAEFASFLANCKRGFIQERRRAHVPPLRLYQPGEAGDDKPNSQKLVG
jgi:UDP-N-acetylglucosamine acyltransferase